MKKLAILLAVALVLSVATMAFANPFVDVPQGHWAYDYLQQVSESGVVEGFADNTFKGQNNMTRYEVAVIVARLLAKIDAKVAAVSNTGNTQTQPPVVDTATAEKIEKLAAEFKPELANLGVKVDGLEAKLTALQGNVAGLATQVGEVQKDVADVKAKVAELGKIKWSGDVKFRAAQKTTETLTLKDDTFGAFYEYNLKLASKPAQDVDLTLNLCTVKDVFGNTSVATNNDFNPVKDRIYVGDENDALKKDKVTLVLKTPKLETVVGHINEVKMGEVLNDDAEIKFYEGAIKKADGTVEHDATLIIKKPYEAYAKFDGKGISFKANPVNDLTVWALAQVNDGGVADKKHNDEIADKGAALDKLSYAAKAEYKLGDITVGGFGGVKTLTTMPEKDEYETFYGVYTNGKFQKLNFAGEYASLKEKAAITGKAELTGYKATADMEVFKGIKVAGMIRKRITDSMTSDILGDKDNTGVTQLGTPSNAYTLKNEDVKPTYWVALGTAGKIYEGAGDFGDYPSFALGNGKLTLKGNVVLKAVDGKFDTFTKNVYLRGKATFNAPIATGTDLEASYKLHYDKNNGDNFKMGDSVVEAKVTNTTLLAPFIRDNKLTVSTTFENVAKSDAKVKAIVTGTVTSNFAANTSFELGGKYVREPDAAKTVWKGYWGEVKVTF